MHKFWATFKLTFSKKLKSKAFIITTLIMIIAILIGANMDKIINLFAGDDEPSKVGIVVQNDKLYQAVQAQNKFQKDDQQLARMKDKEAHQKIKDGTIKKAYVIKEGDNQQLQATILTKSSISASDKEVLSQMLTPIQTMTVANGLGLSQSELQQLQSPVKVKEQIIGQTKGKTQSMSGDDEMVTQIIAMIGTFIMFFIVISYAQQIAMELATEKVSRVSEMIITSVKPSVHILAKISGVLAVAFAQIAILAITCVVAYFVFDLREMLDFIHIESSTHIIRMIIFGVILLILGVLTYVILAAIFGNLTTRIEDMNQSLMPLNMLLIAAFYAGYFGTFNPDNVIVRVLSYVPFFSPFVTFTRLSLMDTPTFEGVIAIIIHLVLIAVLLWFATVTYHKAVLTFEKGLIPTLKRIMPKKSQS
ncbi:ABC transporter permease [Staphylococcus canis]|uniref:ABC transporter permease n=1 Tax=Staphylococcus canis TaxID=2724942 RepID=A0ABS0T6A5_9STAP|nr:ABC transporter permease [Staphylococcus canis]MBI5974282.1 ABC transporter permease [Staphylococcus canis]